MNTHRHRKPHRKTQKGMTRDNVTPVRQEKPKITTPIPPQDVIRKHRKITPKLAHTHARDTPTSSPGGRQAPLFPILYPQHAPKSFRKYGGNLLVLKYELSPPSPPPPPSYTPPPSLLKTPPNKQIRLSSSLGWFSILAHEIVPAYFPPPTPSPNASKQGKRTYFHLFGWFSVLNQHSLAHPITLLPPPP